MEKRISKVIVSSAGGTAGKGSKTYKVALPSAWITTLELEGKHIELQFNGEKITVIPRLPFDEIVLQKKSARHNLMLLKFYNKAELCTKICADYTTKEVYAENTTKKLVKTAFGKNECPTWDDFQIFLEERCVPRARSGLREYLETIGVSEYNPMEIIKKTKGRMAEDDQWLELEKLN